MRIILTSAFAIILTLTTFAQRKEIGQVVQGFVITNENDTIHGLIEVESYEFSETRVKFTERKGKDLLKQKTYKVTDLQGYAMKLNVNNNNEAQKLETWVAYVRKKVEEAPLPFAGKTVFLERKEAGMLNLYIYYIRSNASADYIKYFLLERGNNGNLKKITESNFEEVAAAFIKGCSELVNRVGRGDFNYYNLGRIVWAYNRCNVESLPDSWFHEEDYSTKSGN
jgi:hypothetical protein